MSGAENWCLEYKWHVSGADNGVLITVLTFEINERNTICQSACIHQRGQEAVFNKFEAAAIPLIPKYGGKLLLRCRPGLVIEANMEEPFEIHFISFPSQAHFDRFRGDDTRQAFLHLKEYSVRESFLVSGTRL